MPVTRHKGFDPTSGSSYQEDAEKVGETRGGRVYLKIPGNTPL